MFLLGVNALWERIATSSDGTASVVVGSPTVLVHNGEFDRHAIAHVGLRVNEVMAALHRQGADRVSDVKRASLEPGGAISMELTEDAQSASYGELRRAVAELQHHLDERLAALQIALDASMAAAVRATPSPPVSPPGPSAAG